MKRNYSGTLHDEPKKRWNDRSIGPYPFSYTKLSKDKQNSATVNISQPVLSGFYSKDSDVVYYGDLRGLKYYSESVTCPFDLKLGIEKVVRKDAELTKATKLNNLLQWLLTDTKAKSITVDFLCFRGLLTLLMVTPYENREGWKIMAVLWKGTIYLWQEETEVKMQQRLNETKESLDVCSWGHKFEQYLTTDDPNSPPDVTSPVNENDEFCCVVSARVGEFRLLYGAEVDCLKAKAILQKEEFVKLKTLENFVELKTSRSPDTPKQEQNFRRFKLIKWWAQSFLVGIPKIVCGWKNDDGIVTKLEELSTLRIPGRCSDLWNGNNCLVFLNDMLKLIKSVVAEGTELDVFQFEWNPRQPVRYSNLGKTSGYILLPDWFLESRT